MLAVFSVASIIGQDNYTDYPGISQPGQRSAAGRGGGVTRATAAPTLPSLVTQRPCRSPDRLAGLLCGQFFTGVK